MILEMKVPSPGESITEVEIAEWLVQDGDYVEKDQAIAEVDSDKATLELPAEASGIITLKAEEGDAVEVGAVVCLIDTSAAKPESSSAKATEDKEKEEAPKKEDPKPVTTESKTYATGTASPAAKKVLAEKGIDASSISGTGKDGRITKDDAVNAVPSMGTPTGGNRSSTHSKMSMLRRKVALAVVRALKMYPAVNSMIDGKQMLTYDFVDISIAVSGPKGLMVPVIRNAENLTFRGVESEVKRLALRARDGQITVDEMTGGTFTITNGGVFGSMLSTPIINPPQSGILGMHNIIQRPIAVDGKVEIHPMMYVALSYDHRIIDGKESVGFLVAVKEALENPEELLMDNNVKKALEM